MREKICIDGNWLFHRGDFDKKTPALKGPVYISSKSESEKWGPAARFYDDKSDSYDDGRELSCDRWETVDLPHDYMIEKRRIAVVTIRADTLNTKTRGTENILK